MKTLSAKIALAITLSATAISGYSQKLPNVQETGMRPPLNIKIDGKDLEWKNLFQAHNSNTNISYTVCNDDENLYLALQITDQVALNKMMSGGMTFLIQKSGKKNDKDGISVVYPAYQGTSHLIFSLHRKGEVPPPPEMAAKAADSVMKMNNNRINAEAKYIGVKGVKDIDSIISIYNQDGIKAAGYFDNNKVYTCELSISLKAIGLSAAAADKFSYHILLNGGTNKFTAGGIKMISSTDASGNAASKAMLDEMETRMNNLAATLYATTDFWGEYTLVKK